MAAFLRRRPAGPPAKVIMKRLSILLAIAATLSACGGGGGSGGAGSGAPAVVVDNRPVVDIVPTVGDYYSYRYTGNITSGNEPIPSTPDYTFFYGSAITKLDNDGSWLEIEAFSSQSTIKESRYGSDGALKATRDDRCSSTYTPVEYSVPKDPKVGSEWAESYSRTDRGDCSTRPEGRITSKAVALETITVSAGTFNTVKIVSTPAATIFPNRKELYEQTLWKDAVTHRIIKFVTWVDQTLDSGDKTRITTAGELIGYASAKQGRKHLNIERFAGSWAGSYTGTYSGNCAGEVSPTGALDADCGDGLFSVHGDIDVNGKGTFYLTVNGVKGASFTGTIESLFSIGGVWSAGTASGTWKLEHQ